jgi:hypothetical protein
MADKKHASETAGQHAGAADDDACTVGSVSRSEELRPAADQIRESADHIHRQGKEIASHMVEQGKQMADDLVEQGKGAANTFAGQMQSRLCEILEEQKHMAADRLSTIGSALRQVTEDLHMQKDTLLGPYAKRTADNIENMSQRLHERDIAELFRGIQSYVRRRPEIVLGAGFLGGLLLARFIKTARPKASETDAEHHKEVEPRSHQDFSSWNSDSSQVEEPDDKSL